MEKSKGIYFFFVAIIVLAIFTIVLSYIDSKNVELAPRTISKCIIPLAYPNLIMQSGTICPGNYDYGIGIGADNVKVSCFRQSANSNSSVRFNGRNWASGGNGLVISGVNNVTLEGCDFIGFNNNGVLVGNITNHTSEIKLIDLHVTFNRESGVFVGHNVVNIYVNKSQITDNIIDGVTFRANHLGNVNPTSTIFPRGIYILENILNNNSRAGLYFDAKDYFDYTHHSSGNYNYITRLNNSILVENNTINSNKFAGIVNDGLIIGGSSYYFISSQINKNIINSNFAGNGSGILIIGNLSDRVANNFYRMSNPHPGVGFDYIYSNDIVSNGNGITYIQPYLKVNNSYYPVVPSLINGGNIYANKIYQNQKNGIYYYNENDNVNYSSLSLRVYQNAIDNNGINGIYLRGNKDNYYSDLRGNIFCNDLLSNGIYSLSDSKAIYIDNFNELSLIIGNQNIIEQSVVGMLIDKLLLGVSSESININILENYIGSNNYGIILNETGNYSTNITVNRNDFSSNVLQAYSIYQKTFTHNWWNDYSVGCINVNNDIWCDIPRPIPVANQDIEPKAENMWGHKLRGYFVMANPGVVPKQSCQMMGLPNLLPIAVPISEVVEQPTGTVGLPGEPGNPGNSQSDG